MENMFNQICDEIIRRGLKIKLTAQLRIHKKPCGLLNIAGYYDGLISFLNTMASEGFLAKHFEKRLLVRAEPGMLLDQLNAAVEANTENM